MRRLLCQFRVRKKSKYPQPVIHAHNHHALVRQHFAVLPRLRSRPRLETAAINPHHHRQLRVRLRRRRPHIQIKAIFARPCIAIPHIFERIPLHAAVAKLRRLPHALPIRRRLRLLPSHRAHRRRRIRTPRKSAPVHPRSSSPGPCPYRFSPSGCQREPQKKTPCTPCTAPPKQNIQKNASVTSAPSPVS